MHPLWLYLFTKMFAIFGHCLTVAPYLRRETNVELQATNIYNRPSHDPDAPDAASGTGAG